MGQCHVAYRIYQCTQDELTSLETEAKEIIAEQEGIAVSLKSYWQMVYNYENNCPSY